MCHARIAGPAIFGCSTSPVATRIRRRRPSRAAGSNTRFTVANASRKRGSSMFGWSGVPNSGVISWSGRRRAAWSSRRVSSSPGSASMNASIAYVGAIVWRLTVSSFPSCMLASFARSSVRGSSPPSEIPRRIARSNAAGQDRAEVVVVVVLVDREQGVPLEQVVLAPCAESGRRRVVAVVRDRARDVADPVAEEPEPPTEVDVLEEHEVALVEAADPPEDLGPDDHRGTGREQNVAGRVLHRARGTTEVDPEAVAVDTRAPPRRSRCVDPSQPSTLLATHAMDPSYSSGCIAAAEPVRVRRGRRC